MLSPKYQIRRMTAFSSLSCCLFFSHAGVDFEPPEFLEASAGCCPFHVGNGSHGARADAPPPLSPPPSPPPLPPALSIAISQAQGKRLPVWPLLDMSLCCPRQGWAASQLTAPAAPWQADVPGLHSIPWWAQSQALHGHDQGTEGGATHGRGVVVFLLFHCLLSLLLAHAFLFSHHWKGPSCRPLQRWAATRLAAPAVLPSRHSSRASELGGEGSSCRRPCFCSAGALRDW